MSGSPGMMMMSTHMEEAALPTHEISPQECLELISGGGVGRLAFCSPSGPQIFPLNYAVADQMIVVRTSPYTGLGTALTRKPQCAFEVDSLDMELQRGWSVVAHGMIEPLEDPEEILAMARTSAPTPWAGGSRGLFAGLRWQILSGRRVGLD
jgi:nitroimidazol reductase NimA-like FMN-containing flavoprotein (pyridoxamine 5'-phosphate oxidase superfamily)